MFVSVFTSLPITEFSVSVFSLISASNLRISFSCCCLNISFSIICVFLVPTSSLRVLFLSSNLLNFCSNLASFPEQMKNEGQTLDINEGLNWV